MTNVIVSTPTHCVRVCYPGSSAGSGMSSTDMFGGGGMSGFSSFDGMDTGAS